MKYILGMAKCTLDLKGAKGPKLELDFLRLVDAVKEIRRRGDEAKGCLLVMTPAIAQRVAAWQTKYRADDSVHVATARLSEEQLGIVQDQVRTTREGMVAGTVGDDVAGRSDATAGGQLGEELLRQVIEASEQGIRRSVNEREFPFGIHWDYFGTQAES